MSIFHEFVGALCCCLPAGSDHAGPSRDLKRLSDWRGHPTVRGYDLVEHIADGGFSEIWLARQRSNGELACIKAVYLRKPGLRLEDAAVLRAEARFLRHLEHPGLLRCRDAFETKFHLVMVLEYLSGGEMLHHLHRVEHYSETEAARLFAQVVSAVSYLHNLNIVHRDVKPENVMFVRPVDETLASRAPLRVKLIDLGMAAVIPPTQHPHQGSEEGLEDARAGGCPRRPLLPGRELLRGRGGGRRGGKQERERSPPRGCLGSPGFIAPEVVCGAPHSFAMDVYSLGVLLFVMLTGRKPWPLRDVRSFEYARKPIAAAPGLKDASFLSLSSAARELLLAMLADDPRVRPTTQQVLRHDFIAGALRAGRSGAAALGRPLDDAIKRRMAQLASLRRFRGLAFAMMSSRGEGQRQSEFVAQVAARRMELHRDLLVRAKTRRAAEQAARRSQEEQQRQPKQQQQQRLGEERPQQHQHAGSPVRLSADSTSSQRPLLLSSPRSSHERWRGSADSPACQGAPQRWSADEQRLRLQQPRLSHLGAPCAAARVQRLSLESAAAVARTGASHVAGSAITGSHAHPALQANGQHMAGHVHHHDLQYHKLETVPEPGERCAVAPGVAPHGTPSAAQGRPPLPPRIGRIAGEAGQPAAGATPAPHRGWSSSGRREAGFAAVAEGCGRAPVAAPRQRPHHATQPAAERRGGRGSGRGLHRGHASELELAALDPLTLIRELPAQTADGGRPVGQGPVPTGSGRGCTLGRAHSAPESVVAAAAGPALSLAEAGAGPRGGTGRGAEAARGGNAAWLDGLAMGADMRAFSANSWTLDLLANAELLAALTGMDLNLAADASNRGSSSAADYSNVDGGTVYASTLYGAASNLSAAIDAALAGAGPPADLPGGAGNGTVHGTGDAAAAAAAAAFRQLRPELSGAASAAPSDATVHAATQAAAALLAAAAAAGSEGSVRRGDGAAAAAVAKRRSREQGPQAAYASALAALSGAGADAGNGSSPAPTRPVAGAASPSAARNAAATGLSPFTAAAALESALPAQPGALFGAFSQSPIRPALEAGSGWSLAARVSGAGIQLPARSVGPSAAAAAAAAEGGSGSAMAWDNLSAHHTPADPALPLPLLRAPRAEALEGANSPPACDVPYTSLHLTASAARLGVALPPAASAVAAAEARSHAAAVLGSPLRPVSLALVHLDEHVAAQQAALEETLHGGTLWLRSAAAAGGAPAGATAQGSGGAEQWGGGVGAATGSPALRSGLTAGALHGDAGGHGCTKPTPCAGPPSRPGLPPVAEGAVAGGSRGGDASGGPSRPAAAASSVVEPTGATPSVPVMPGSASMAGLMLSRWRSPFEALAFAPLTGGAPLDACGAHGSSVHHASGR